MDALPDADDRLSTHGVDPLEVVDTNEKRTCTSSETQEQLGCAFREAARRGVGGSAPRLEHVRKLGRDKLHERAEGIAGGFAQCLFSRRALRRRASTGRRHICLEESAEGCERRVPFTAAYLENAAAHLARPRGRCG
jgi:hypothetical protein